MNLNQPARGNDSKLLGLELLRFAAACAVLVWHYQHFAFNGSTINIQRSQQPFYSVLKLFYEYGWYGVQVFWCISGFIFFWRYSQLVAEKKISGWQFFVQRFSRLYPLHFLTLLLVACLQAVYSARLGHPFVYQHNDGFHFFLQLFMASHWGWQSGHSFNGPIWSVSVELLVYLLFFAGIRLLGRSVWPCVLVVALSVVLKVAGASTPVSNCAGMFYVGGISALLLRDIAGVKALILLRVFCAAAPVLTWLIVPAPSEHFVYFCLLGYVPLLLYCLAQPLSLPSRVLGIVEVAGNMTYSSYLLHFPVQILIAMYYSFSAQAIPVYSTSLFFSFMSLTCVAAYLSYYYLELPAQTWLRRHLITPTAVATARSNI